MDVFLADRDVSVLGYGGVNLNIFQPDTATTAYGKVVWTGQQSDDMMLSEVVDSDDVIFQREKTEEEQVYSDYWDQGMVFCGVKQRVLRRLFIRLKGGC